MDDPTLGALPSDVPDPLSFLSEEFPSLDPPSVLLEPSPPQLSCSPNASSPDPSSPEAVAPAAADDASAAPAGLDELLTLIDWKGKNSAKGKRVRGSASEAREKHIQREKQRRMDSTALVEELDRIVPATEPSGKRTKVNALRDAVDYVRRVQDVALALIEENRRLSSALAQQPALAPSASAFLTSRAPTIGRQDIARLFVAGIFLFWVSLVPLPWAVQTQHDTFSSRHILSVATLTSPSAWLATLWSVALRIATIVASAACLWLVFILQEYSRIPQAKLTEARRLFRCAEVAAERQSNWVLAQVRMNEAMAVLNQSVPDSTVGELLFLIIQIIRTLFHWIVIGRWVEQALVRYFHRREATIMEARMYLYSSRIGPLGARLEDLRPLRFCGCMLASTCGLRAANAPQQFLDEMHSALCLFDDLRASAGGVTYYGMRVCIKLAAVAFPPLKAALQPMDQCDWTLMRMTSNSDRHLNDILAEVMAEIPSLQDMALTRAIITAGMMCFAMRRFEDAFLLLTEGVCRGINGAHMPVYSTRIATGTILICARHIGKLDEARTLLSSLERLTVCVPDASANVLSAERLFLLCAQIMCVREHDFMSLVTLSNHFNALCNSIGVQRMFNVPFAIEAVLERLLSALDLANDVLLRKAPDLNEAQLAVLHHRAELHDLASALLRVLNQYASWADYVVPVIERTQGWYACVSQRSGEALPHLRLSVSEARRLDLPLQEARTRELMERRGLWRKEDEQTPGAALAV